MEWTYVMEWFKNEHLMDFLSECSVSKLSFVSCSPAVYG